MVNKDYQIQGSRNLASVNKQHHSIVWWQMRFDIFNCLGVDRECDRETDRQTR